MFLPYGLVSVIEAEGGTMEVFLLFKRDQRSVETGCQKHEYEPRGNRFHDLFWKTGWGNDVFYLAPGKDLLDLLAVSGNHQAGSGQALMMEQRPGVTSGGTTLRSCIIPAHELSATKRTTLLPERQDERWTSPAKRIVELCKGHGQLLTQDKMVELAAAKLGRPSDPNWRSHKNKIQEDAPDMEELRVEAHQENAQNTKFKTGDEVSCITCDIEV